MHCTLIFSFVTTFLFTIHTPNEVTIKTLLSSDETTVYVNLSLPSDANVSFTLSSDSGESKHQWKKQILSRGAHQIALPLPILAQGKYLLLIKVGDNQYQQLVYLTRGGSPDQGINK